MPRARWFWLIYVLLVLTLGVGRTIEKILRDSGGFGGRYGPALGAIFISVGVLGHVMRRPVGWVWLWRFVLALALLAAIGLLYLEWTVLASDTPPRIHALILVSVALLIPAQVALFRYSCGSRDLWRRSTPAMRD